MAASMSCTQKSLLRPAYGLYIESVLIREKITGLFASPRRPAARWKGLSEFQLNYPSWRLNRLKSEKIHQYAKHLPLDHPYGIPHLAS